MASAAQIAANRRNALKSTGPRTPNGKSASARNARKHGLHSRELLISEAVQNEIRQIEAKYREEFCEQGMRPLLRQLAEAEWRMAYALRVEADLEQGCSTMLKVYRFEARARSDWHRALHLLIELKKISNSKPIASSSGIPRRRPDRPDRRQNHPSGGRLVQRVEVNSGCAAVQQL